MNPSESAVIHIAPLRDSERSRWEVLWGEYQRFYAVQLPGGVTDLTWQRLHDGRIHGLGARDSADSPVGIVHFLFHEDTCEVIWKRVLEWMAPNGAVKRANAGRLTGIAPMRSWPARPSRNSLNS